MTPSDFFKHTCSCRTEPCLGTIFSAACGLYWYANDWHGGQSSELYSILSARLEYRPGMGESGPEPESTDADVYAALESGELDPTELCTWINAEYPAASERNG